MIEETRLITVGIDLGKKGERSAIAGVERITSLWPAHEFEYHVRGLKRLEPKIEYSELNQWLIGIFCLDEMTTRDLKVRTIIDQTAVGAPIVDHVMRGIGRAARRVKISGNHEGMRYVDGCYEISKQTLIGGLEVALETKQLKIIRCLTEVSHLVDELVNFSNRKTMRGATGDVWREGPSDDLIFAVALSLYEAQQPPDFRYEFL